MQHQKDIFFSFFRLFTTIVIDIPSESQTRAWACTSICYISHIHGFTLRNAMRVALTLLSLYFKVDWISFMCNVAVVIPLNCLIHSLWHTQTRTNFNVCMLKVYCNFIERKWISPFYSIQRLCMHNFPFFRLKYKFINFLLYIHITFSQPGRQALSQRIKEYIKSNFNWIAA